MAVCGCIIVSVSVPVCVCVVGSVFLCVRSGRDVLSSGVLFQYVFQLYLVVVWGHFHGNPSQK